MSLLGDGVRGPQASTPSRHPLLSYLGSRDRSWWPWALRWHHSGSSTLKSWGRFAQGTCDPSVTWTTRPHHQSVSWEHALCQNAAPACHVVLLRRPGVCSCGRPAQLCSLTGSDYLWSAELFPLTGGFTQLVNQLVDHKALQLSTAH
jgi:hypothetical protein